VALYDSPSPGFFVLQRTGATGLFRVHLSTVDAAKLLLAVTAVVSALSPFSAPAVATTLVVFLGCALAVPVWNALAVRRSVYCLGLNCEER
jgi:hypothetical protein